MLVSPGLVTQQQQDINCDGSTKSSDCEPNDVHNSESDLGAALDLGSDTNSDSDCTQQQSQQSRFVLSKQRRQREQQGPRRAQQQSRSVQRQRRAQERRRRQRLWQQGARIALHWSDDDHTEDTATLCSKTEGGENNVESALFRELSDASLVLTLPLPRALFSLSLEQSNFAMLELQRAAGLLSVGPRALATAALKSLAQGHLEQSSAVAHSELQEAAQSHTADDASDNTCIYKRSCGGSESKYLRLWRVAPALSPLLTPWLGSQSS
mgnify:FL=1